MKPILKWAGGKTALLENIKTLMPENYSTYYEPFVGGGAVFFNIDSDVSVINDKNEELINCYIQVRDHVEELMPLLDELQNNHSEQKSYELRSIFNLRKSTGKLDVYDAALMIYLNKAGFNGMYRENANGNFNIPSGKRKAVNLYEKDNLLEVSERLKHATILSGDFEDALKMLKRVILFILTAHMIRHLVIIKREDFLEKIIKDWRICAINLQKKIFTFY